MADRRQLRDKVAIITGASSGIGRAIALELARAGARVVLASRDEAALEALSEEIQGGGGKSLIVPTDVTQDRDVEELIKRVIETWGQVDVLVANSGQYVRGRIEELSQAHFLKAMDVNFFGALRPVLRVLPHMLKRGSGHIVLMNSLDGRWGLPTDSPYVASKFALRGFGNVLRQDLHGTGVGVTSVFPGRVDTPMIDYLRVPRVSPKIPAEAVARATVCGIVRKTPEVIVPVEGIGIVGLNLLPPRLADWLVRRLHLQGWGEYPRDA